MNLMERIETNHICVWESGLYMRNCGSVIRCRFCTPEGWPMLQHQGLLRFTSRACANARTICACTVTQLHKHNQAPPPLSASSQSDLQHVLASQPSIATLASILRQCGTSKTLLDGILVHKHIQKQGLHCNIYISNCLVLMYAECGSMDNAQQVFNRIPRPNSYSWSILIKAYADNNNLDEARCVLAQIPNPNVVAYNTMIAAYAQKQQGIEALGLFWKMQEYGIEPDTVTLICGLEACSSLTTLEEAQGFLAYISRSKLAEDKSVKTAFITLLGNFGRPDEGWEIFKNLLHRDVVSWNAMISAYAQNGHSKKAFNLYLQMHLQGMVASPATLACALDACTGLLDLEEGLRIHKFMVFYGYDGDLALGVPLIHMYGKCGCLTEARDSFDRIVSHNVVSWTALMTACVDGNGDEEALDVFFRMQYHGFDPNEVTFTCALDACASLAALEEGFSVHAATVYNAHEDDELVGTALLHMYGKCGLVGNARSVFNKIRQKDVAAWNAMLTVCAQSGHGKLTIEHFDEMQKAGFRPNNVSFTCLLSVCSHMGWVEAGREYFVSLFKSHSLLPTSEHCSCMIDLLGRAGCLEEAEGLLNRLPMGKLAPLWTSLLAACKTHGDVHCGFRAADQFTELDPRDPGPFVMLANICATVG